MSKDDPKNFSWSKLGQREVSHFMGHEMIYDLITGTLDTERKKATEEFVASSKDAQQDMMKILNGMQYIERLSETVVSEVVLGQIGEPATYVSLLLKKTKFQHWPTSVKWALEALIVVSFMIMISLMIPWDKVSKFNPFPDKKVTILAEIDKIQQVGDPEKLKNIELSEPAEFADDEKPAIKAPAPVVTASKPLEVPAAETAVIAANKKSSEGSIYRGSLDVTNLDVVGPKIVEKIVELGGRKAGEVELGWQKTPGEAYFHLTLPEAKYEELLTFLGTYGPAQIKKEKHPRVMPDGIIRLIVTISEAKQ